MTVASGPIGIGCRVDHPVFSVVADRLRGRGFEVRFLDPDRRVGDETLRTLSLLVTKSTTPTTVRTLLAAERRGVPTWNSATGVMACVSRLSALCALESVGFRVPTVYPARPAAGDYVAKSRYHWGYPPRLNGEGEIYEGLLPCDPVDFKYYVVDDGAEYRAVTLRATSKLFGSKEILGRSTPRPDYVDGIRRLMERLEMRALGVDFVETDEDYYAVDVNPCPSFARTGLEGALVASIVSAVR
ncbi:hypothetical protein SAMN04487948_101144 [Halogranum amylolyticum]|uniref:ATP-grasp domain-containing protein n=1 Tax=Halogranum amylolyticum TaxID=660520 RepID=A0A1H8MWR6_9EURY|nr:hypothetical protein [Halogranum amylolyticum]SEO21719.1 hypothetical protein SAMN04487948_101144 [Halogranum amylolyticum]